MASRTRGSVCRSSTVSSSKRESFRTVLTARRLYEKMSDVAATYMPLMLGTYRYRSVVAQPWLLGFNPDPFYPEPWKYVDIDVARKQRAGQ